MPIINPQETYTYRKYFDLRIAPIDLCQYFGYGLIRTQIQPVGELINTESVKQDILEISPQLLSPNEQAKREMFVAPVVKLVVKVTHALIRIEYPINVSPQLQGEVDYILSVENLQELLIIAAKRDDIDYGFTQLIAQMIGVDQWDSAPSIELQPVLLGAVTTGVFWQFAQLDRRTKQVTQGLNSFRSPEDLDEVVRMLVHALKGGQTAQSS